MYYNLNWFIEGRIKMQNTKNHIKRCNQLLFVITMVLCAFYLINVLLYVLIYKVFYWKFLIVTFAVMGALAGSYYKLRESKKALYVLSGLFSIAYCFTLVIFEECYYSYLFAIVFAGILYSDFKFIIITATFGEVAILASIFYKWKVMGIFHLVEFVYMPCMVLLLVFIYYIGTMLLNKFMTESQDEIVSVSQKNEKTAQEVVTTVSQINEKFSDIMDELATINQQADNNNNSMRAIADSTEETVSEINHQAVMTSDIQNTISETMSNVETVHKTTEEVLELTKNGISMAQELIKQSEHVNQSTNQMSETIRALVGRVRDVSEITNAIMSISEQTNLLALNASIEAARAGEAGRGFAVVADEIRNLSDETKSSTQQITDIIHELSQVTEETNKILDESVKSIGRQNQQVKNVNESFSNSGIFMNNLKVLIDGIVRDINKINTANSKIVQSINQLSASTEEISGCSQESSSSTELITSRIDEFTNEIQEVYQELEDLTDRIV